MANSIYYSYESFVMKGIQHFYLKSLQIISHRIYMYLGGVFMAIQHKSRVAYYRCSGSQLLKSAQVFSPSDNNMWKSRHQGSKHTFCCTLPENVQSLMPTSNSLMQKYIHFIQSTFASLDTQPFASKGCPQHQQTTINTILLCLRDNKVSIKQEKYLS